MEALRQLLPDLLPAGLTLAVVVVVLAGAHLLLERRWGVAPGSRWRIQLVLLALTFVGLLALIVALPLGDTLRGQILSLIGVLLSATIALAATTFVGNAMAGVLLRVVRNFELGDFVEVGRQFGRVSERGLFHTEIQTEDRDLVTLPNLYLLTQPVKLIRASGTIISARVSLGYDVPRQRIEERLLAAAAGIELEEPFVQILELGDFAVTYRVAGLLREVKQLLTTRSRLRQAVLDELHGAGTRDRLAVLHEHPRGGRGTGVRAAGGGAGGGRGAGGAGRRDGGLRQGRGGRGDGAAAGARRHRRARERALAAAAGSRGAAVAPGESVRSPAG